jgi:hypothetical protein
VAPAASRDGMRRSEKAKVPEEAQPQVQRLRDPSTSHIYTQTPNTLPRGFGWCIHCGVEVTELSTNKQHSLSSLCAYLSAKSALAASVCVYIVCSSQHTVPRGAGQAHVPVPAEKRREEERRGEREEREKPVA